MLLRPLPRPIAALVAVGAGLLTDTAFPDRGWWAMAFVGVALLYIAVDRQRTGFSFVLGFLWGLGFFLPHIAWADYVVGPVPWIALSTAEALFVGLGCGAWALIRQTLGLRLLQGLRPVVFAVIFTTTEVVRSAFPFGGFPWGRLAFSQPGSPVGRLAWLGGPTVVSLVVALIAALLGGAILHLLRLRWGRAGRSVIVAFGLLIVGLAVPLATQAENGYLHVGAVQGNVAEPGLGAFENRYEVLKNHVAGTFALLDEVEPGDLDVVLWPENSSDVDPREDKGVYDLIDSAAAALDAPILVGTQQYVPAKGGATARGRYNQGVLWVAGEGIVDTYAKQHPAPFAEYVPMRDIARKFSSAVDLVTTDMLAGEEPGVFEITTPRHESPVLLGDVICFEVAYDDVVRSAVTHGGQLLVVQTNNATFGYTPESTQQLAMAQIRAIETGRATIQVSTVGVSAVIEANGVIKQRTELFTPDTLIAKMPLRTSITPAVKIGSLPSWIVSIATLVMLGIAIPSTVASRRMRR